MRLRAKREEGRARLQSCRESQPQTLKRVRVSAGYGTSKLVPFPFRREAEFFPQLVQSCWIFAP